MEMNEQNEEQVLFRKDIEAKIIAKAWKDEAYKQRLLADPKAVIEEESGMKFSDSVSVQVTEENTNSLYLTLPMSPEIEGVNLSEEELEMIAGGARFRPFDTLSVLLGPKKNKPTDSWIPDIIKDTGKVGFGAITAYTTFRATQQ